MSVNKKRWVSFFPKKCIEAFKFNTILGQEQNCWRNIATNLLAKTGLDLFLYFLARMDFFEAFDQLIVRQLHDGKFGDFRH